MKYILILWLGLFSINMLGQDLKLELYVNGVLYTRDMHLYSDDVVTVLLVNTDENKQYKISKMKLRWMVTKGATPFAFKLKYLKHLFVKNEEIYNYQEYFFVHKETRWYDLEKFKVAYSDFSNNANLNIPLTFFADHPCTTRVILKIDNIQALDNGQITKVSSLDFDFSEEYEVWAHWDCD